MDVIRCYSLEVQFGFCTRQTATVVQQIILHSHVSRMFHHLIAFSMVHQSIHPFTVFIHMDVLVPLNAHHQFILFYLRHTFLFQKIEEEYTKRQSGKCQYRTDSLVCKHPIHTHVVESFQPVILHQIVKAFRKPALTTNSNSIEQQIKYRQQHNTGYIRYQQTHSNGKSLVHKDGTRYTAHEY